MNDCEKQGGFERKNDWSERLADWSEEKKEREKSTSRPVYILEELTVFPPLGARIRISLPDGSADHEGREIEQRIHYGLLVGESEIDNNSKPLISTELENRDPDGESSGPSVHRGYPLTLLSEVLDRRMP